MPPNIQRSLATTVRAASVMIVAFFTSAAHAAEVRVLSAAAMQSVFKDVSDDFQLTTGYNMIIHYGTIGAVNEWTMAGEEADLIIGSSRSMLTLVKARKISARSLTPICRTGIGVVVAKGIELDVKSVEDFTRALISTKAVVYADPARGGAAGIHVAKVIAQLGLTEQLKPKIRLGAGGDITEVTLGLGPSALGITQISEIADKPKAQLVGPLPEELQNYTVFVAGVPANAPQSEGTAALLKFLRSPKVIAVVKAKGMKDFGSDGGSE
ncbi:MAG: substrate-binding domain-containing protein [Pseudolabrys sp.]